MNRARTTIVWLLSPLLLSGCMVGPNYKPPATHAPDAWTDAAQRSAAREIDRMWWSDFHDPELDALITRAMDANIDLRVAVGRLREARAQRGVVSAALFPHVDLSGSYSNSRFSENGFLQGFEVPGAGGSGSLPGAIVPGQQINLYQVGLDASWEIDIFGGQRRAVQEAEGNLAAAEFDTGDVIRAVTAEVADGYMRLRGLQARLDIAKSTAASDQKTFDILHEQVGAGVANDFDLARAESQAATARSAIPEIEGAVRVAIRRLEVLLGAMPGALDAELDLAAPIPSPPDALDAGIPSDTLRRRPDVRAAERRLAAATARVGVATAALFPRFSLTGSFGFQSQTIEDLPKGDSRFWVIGPAMRWPILDFGEIRSNIDVQNARQQQAEATYEGTVIQALSDVEVALVRLSRERQRGAELDQAAAAADHALRIAEDRYHNGVLEYTDLLDAQRTQNAAHDAAVQSRTAAATETVALYKALGGGWRDLAKNKSEGLTGQAIDSE